MPQYDVVPFVAKIGNREGVGAAAEQLRALINAKAADGWRYVRLESVEIHQDGTAGCFGIGATPSRLIRFDMVVFEK